MREAEDAPGPLLSAADRDALLRRFDELHRPRRGVSRRCLHADVAPLLAGNYVATARADGARYALLLAELEGVAFSALVDERRELYHVPVAAARPAYAGSLFYGELVWASRGGGEAQCFLVDDVSPFWGGRA